MSNELKIGFLAIVIIALSIWGFNFIMGKNMLSRSNTINVEYEQIDQMKEAAPVLINGYQVGVVRRIKLNPENMRSILVQLELDKEIKIPKTAKALIASDGVMGGKMINLEFDEPCSGDDCAKSGDFIEGKTLGLLESMLGESMTNTLTNDFKGTAVAVVDTFSSKLTNPDPNSSLGKAMADLEVIIGNLKSTTGSLDNMLATSGAKLGQVMDDLAVISGALEKNNSKIISMLDNANTFTSKLNKLELEETLSSANGSMKQLESTLSSTEKTMKEVESLFGKMKEGDGTVGKLLNDDKLYDNLKELSKSLTLLTSDMRIHPERYRRILAKKTKTDPITEVPAEVKN